MPHQFLDDNRVHAVREHRCAEGHAQGVEIDPPAEFVVNRNAGRFEIFAQCFNARNMVSEGSCGRFRVGRHDLAQHGDQFGMQRQDGVLPILADRGGHTHVRIRFVQVQIGPLEPVQLLPAQAGVESRGIHHRPEERRDLEQRGKLLGGERAPAGLVAPRVDPLDEFEGIVLQVALLAEPMKESFGVGEDIVDGFGAQLALSAPLHKRTGIDAPQILPA
jgi:hypothetical protein